MDTSRDALPKLDPQEEHYRIPSPREGLQMFVRRLASASPSGAERRPVLYVHGATFPSALSIAHRSDGRSWRDALCAAGFDVWGLDFHGFGGSDPYPEMAEPAHAHGPLCLAADAEAQLAAAVRFILGHVGAASLSLVAHSWGCMVAGRFAGARPTLVDRLALFAPITRRDGPRYAKRPDGPAWRVITPEDQWARFTEDVPTGEPPVFARAHFEEWAQHYLDSDPESRSRDPMGVKVPSGPFVEILRAWHGELAWDPGLVQAPTAILRGAWDGLVTDADARWLWDALAHSPVKRDVKIGRGTHLLHLEAMRPALWRESVTFLAGEGWAALPRKSQPDCPTNSTNRKPEGEHPMTDETQPKDIPGYNPGAPEVAKSPITMDEWKELQASAFFTDEDVIYLRLSYDVLKDQAEDLVKVWRGIIFLHPHLKAYDEDPRTGEVDTAYTARVAKRFAQWVLDTAKAEYDQSWLDYQYEIGLRHHRTKKNQTDDGHTLGHIRARDLIAFSAATVAPMKPYLEKGGLSPEIVSRMHEAWWKSMILQVTLWSQPYMREGDF